MDSRGEDYNYELKDQYGNTEKRGSFHVGPPSSNVVGDALFCIGFCILLVLYNGIVAILEFFGCEPGMADEIASYIFLFIIIGIPAILIIKALIKEK